MVAVALNSDRSAPALPRWAVLACALLATAVAGRVHLHLIGPVYDDRRLQWPHEADAVLLTSYTECSPMTAIETLTAGGVLVATDTCHLDLPAAAGAARVVPRSRARLRDSIIQLLEDPAAAEAQRSATRSYAREHLEWQALAVAMRGFYHSLLPGRAACAA